MTSARESHEGPLELEERIYLVKPPQYRENEPMMLLDIILLFWKDEECVEQNKIRYVFSGNMTVDEVLDLVIERNPNLLWTERYAFCRIPNQLVLTTSGKDLVALRDPLALLKHILQDKDTVVISNVFDHPEELLRAQERRQIRAAKILLMFVLTFSLIIYTIGTIAENFG